MEETEDEGGRRKDCRLEQVDVEPGSEETEDEEKRKKDCRLEQDDVEPGWKRQKMRGKGGRTEER